MSDQGKRVGIIFVHGIGEQRRFEHLDTEVRPFIDALLRRKPNGLTVEISGGEASTLRADQDTWSAQPVRAIVSEGDRKTAIHFHEVWWADVNEPYTLWKQVKFWFWGLSVWAFPNAKKAVRAKEVMALPVFSVGRIRNSTIVARLRLFFVCNVFLMGAVTVGAFTVLARRLLNFAPWKPVRIFVNYVSSVKLYVQRTRSDGGFLDAYQEPPRVSIRRRMIRTIADVASADYDRWYIFAHSLGSVVAFNGLMENAHVLPNYLDERRWQRMITEQRGGAARKDKDVLTDISSMMPSRPLWLEPTHAVYRDKLFEKFCGLLTYGSPLDKFAAIWPNRVPVNVKEKAFVPEAEWINVFDPTDPVAANLEAFDLADSELKPDNQGYSAYWVLLLSHLKYFTKKRRGECLADRLAEWVLSGGAFSLPESQPYGRWFMPGSRAQGLRRTLELIWVVAVYLLLSFGAALMYWLVLVRKPTFSPAPEGGPFAQSRWSWLGSTPPLSWVRVFLEDYLPAIGEWTAEQFGSLFTAIDSTRLGHGVFHAIEVIWDWIAAAADVALGWLLTCGLVIADHVILSVGLKTDGRVSSTVWHAISYMPTVMVEVLAITFAVGVGMNIIWYLQSRDRAPQVPVPPASETPTRDLRTAAA